MPVHYNINPALNMVIFVCTGLISGPELFEAFERALRDNRFQQDMILIFDLFAARDNLDLQDVRELLRQTNVLAERGYQPAQIVVLSISTGIHIMVETLQLMYEKAPSNIKICYSLDQAINSLGFSELREKIVTFWEESHQA